MRYFHDTNDSLCVEWEQSPGLGISRRAWVQHRQPDDQEKNWARVPDGRYLNVGRLNDAGNLGGIPADFPIFSALSDHQILTAFVHSVSAITGTQLPDDISN
jgi:hypothetical protein